MSVPIVFRPEAEQDVVAGRDWYEEQLPGLGSQFVVRLSAALDQIASMPGMYALIWEDVRSCRLRGFSYLIYYRVLSDRVEVLAVLHGSRHPSAWQGRV
jgi:plasmid stabilization system protein ParE